MIYTTTLDRLAKGITVTVTIIFFVVIVTQLQVFYIQRNAAAILLAIFLFFVYIIAIGFRPVKYTITNDKLIIHRLFKDVQISRTSILGAEIIDKEKIKWSLRTLGVGGLFGYYGKFANATYGNMTWYATRKDKMILVRTSDNQKIVLTPDNAEQFITEIYKSDPDKNMAAFS